MKRIALHSVPRSGSTWLGSILDSHPNVAYRFQPLFSYAFKSYLNQNSDLEAIKAFFKEILYSEDSFINQVEAKQRGIVPKFEKENLKAIIYKEVRYHNILENLIAKDQDLKIIGLIRNPYATLNSWFKAPREFRKDLGWKVKEEWRLAPKKNNNSPEEFYGYEKWKETAYLFHKLKSENPNRFLIVEYDRLLHHTEDVVRQIFDFIGLTVTNETKEFIQISKTKNNTNTYGVYKVKSKDDSWKKNLPEFIKVAIWEDLQGTPLEKYLNI